MSVGKIAINALKVLGGAALLGGIIWAFTGEHGDSENSDSWDDYNYYNQWLWNKINHRNDYENACE